MDLLRLLLPQIAGVLTFLIILWLIAIYLVNPNISDEYRKYVVKICWIISIIAIVIFFLCVGNITVTNDIPRSSIDTQPSTKDKMIDNFEERSKQSASLPLDTTLKK